MRIWKYEIIVRRTNRDHEWKMLADKGDKIPAIKMYREVYRTKKSVPCLREAHDAVLKYMNKGY